MLAPTRTFAVPKTPDATSREQAWVWYESRAPEQQAHLPVVNIW